MYDSDTARMRCHMELKNGTVVISKAGRDKNKPMMIVEITENGVFVCDGKERPLENPKRKNPKHLSATQYVLSPETTATNRSLKKALQQIMSQTEREAE